MVGGGQMRDRSTKYKNIEEQIEDKKNDFHANPPLIDLPEILDRIYRLIGQSYEVEP